MILIFNFVFSNSLQFCYIMIINLRNYASSSYVTNVTVNTVTTQFIKNKILIEKR